MTRRMSLVRTVLFIVGGAVVLIDIILSFVTLHVINFLYSAVHDNVEILGFLSVDTDATLSLLYALHIILCIRLAFMTLSILRSIICFVKQCLNMSVNNSNGARFILDVTNHSSMTYTSNHSQTE